MSLMQTENNCTGPINLGNPVEFQIKQLAERVLALVGSRSDIIYKKLPQDDPQQRRPDIALAKAQLNWRPSIALDEGLCRTVEYFRELLGKSTLSGWLWQSSPGRIVNLVIKEAHLVSHALMQTDGSSILGARYA